MTSDTCIWNAYDILEAATNDGLQEVFVEVLEEVVSQLRDVGFTPLIPFHHHGTVRNIDVKAFKNFQYIRISNQMNIKITR